MLTIKRTEGSDTDFRQLVFLLDEGLKLTDGPEFSFFAQYNKSDDIKNVVVAYLDDNAAGCGAFKPYGEDTVEIKRMYVKPEFRGKGIAAAILRELESWAVESGFQTAILETGSMLIPAISLYEKSGYERIANYGQYENVATSVCMKKTIR